MTNPVRYAVAAAAVLVVALIGFRFLPANDSFGGPTTAAPTTAPTIAPSSPTPAPLATGEFSSHGVAASIDARGAGSDVTGTMALSDTGLTATVDLECSRTTESGLLMIGGLLTNSTFTEFFPAGHRVAVVFQAGAPVKAVWYIVLPGDEPMPTCQALMDFMATDEAEFIDGLEPIEGTVQLGP